MRRLGGICYTSDLKLVEIVRGETRAYRLVFNPVAEGGYVVTCPAVPALVTKGESLKEALAMAHQAMERCLETLLARGQEVPEGEVLSGRRV